ncbi:MAG TPA: RNA polymerase sigma factor [Blastocatellia bacterium]|nr:RNA polymerase sigma factor [Blastocatellia bacterium]
MPKHAGGRPAGDGIPPAGTYVEEKQVIENFLATGAEEAFCALFEAVCVRLRRYFLLRGLDAATAEDLTQNVFVKVYRQKGELRAADHFYGWLFAIARNELISYWRLEQSGGEKVEFESLGDRHASSLVTEPEVLPAMRLMDLLKALEPAERDLVVLRFVEGLSYEELAVALRLPLGTIKWRIFNARKKLSRIIAASPEGRARQRIN